MKNLTQGFIKAAKLIDSGEEKFSCIALKRIFGPPGICIYSDVPEVRFYLESIGKDWSIFDARCSKKDNVKEIRVLLLCLMAVAWKDLKEQ